MANAPDRQTTTSGWERHLQTLISSAALLLLGWLFTQTQDMGNQISRMSEQIGFLRLQVQSGLEDRYRASDAAKDFAARDQRITEIKERLAEQFVRLRALENSDAARRRDGSD